MHAMIFPHLSYCITTWSQAGKTTTKPMHSLYKYTLKVLDKKAIKYHHCDIISKYNLLSYDNFVHYANMCLMYRIIHNLAPPPLKEFVSLCSDNIKQTRAAIRGNCIIHLRRTEFGRSAFSIRATNMWNSTPSSIRQSPTFTSFKHQLKLWLKSQQSCSH